MLVFSDTEHYSNRYGSINHCALMLLPDGIFEITYCWFYCFRELYRLYDKYSLGHLRFNFRFLQDFLSSGLPITSGRKVCIVLCALG